MSYGRYLMIISLSLSYFLSPFFSNLSPVLPLTLSLSFFYLSLTLPPSLSARPMIATAIVGYLLW